MFAINIVKIFAWVLQIIPLFLAWIFACKCVNRWFKCLERNWSHSGCKSPSFEYRLTVRSLRVFKYPYCETSRIYQLVEESPSSTNAIAGTFEPPLDENAYITVVIEPALDDGDNIFLDTQEEILALGLDLNFELSQNDPVTDGGYKITDTAFLNLDLGEEDSTTAWLGSSNDEYADTANAWMSPTPDEGYPDTFGLLTSWAIGSFIRLLSSNITIRVFSAEDQYHTCRKMDHTLPSVSAREKRTT